ncbi:hypothetical protein KXX58_006200 [Aspergillus fumigatus]|nr:hypothetical protein KXX58_006200 [Aspergillus fumigatus]KAH2945103.1 hypothetical protein KXV49_006390 [Aspergillus fumigatus]
MCLSRDNPTGNVSTSLTRGYDVVGDLRDDDDAHWPITPARVAAIPPYHVADWPEKPEVWNGGGALMGFDPLNFIHFGEIAALSPRCACDDLHGKPAKVNSQVAKVWPRSLLAFSLFVGSPMMLTWQSQSMRDARGQSFHIGRFRRVSTMPNVEIVEASVQTRPFPTLEMDFGDP